MTSTRIGIQEAADILDVSTKTVRRYIADGTLAAERVGKRLIKVNKADVDALAVPVPAVGPVERAS